MKTLSMILLASGLLGLSSCLKNDIEPPHGEYSDLAAFIESQKPVEQHFGINADNYSTILGAKGTQIEFFPSSFEFADGTIAVGDIDITLVEVLSRTDVIYSGIFPVEGNDPLNSGGEYYVGASQGGEELFLRDGYYYSAVVPAQTYDPAMAIFAGGKSLTNASWSFVNSSLDSIGYMNLPLFDDLSDTYSMLTDEIGWVNCDAYPYDFPRVNFNLTITGITGLNSSNTMVFTIFDDINSVYMLAPPDSNYCMFNDIAQTYMHIVVMAVTKSYLYYGSLSVTPDENGEYTIHVAPTTEEAMNAAILAL